MTRKIKTPFSTRWAGFFDGSNVLFSVRAAHYGHSNNTYIHEAVLEGCAIAFLLPSLIIHTAVIDRRVMFWLTSRTRTFENQVTLNTLPSISKNT